MTEMTAAELERFLDDRVQDLVTELRVTDAVRKMVHAKQQAANQTPTVRRRNLRLLQGGAS